MFEVKTALRFNDTFINCSVHPANTLVSWKYRDILLSNNSDKYTQNSSGLIVHNVTNDDEGQYVCSIDQRKKAFISLKVVCKLLLVMTGVGYFICRATYAVFSTKSDSSSQY